MTTDGGTRTDAEELRERVRERYARAALAVVGPGDEQGDQRVDDQPAGASCCSPAGASCCSPTDASCCSPAQEIDFGAGLYEAADRDGLPGAAVLASLGCGNPTAVAELREGEIVLDLGSGGGIDVLLSARRVGPSGRAYGLDMTEEMLALARRNAAEAGVGNAEFLRGHIEAVPLPAETVDVVISNCVINLSVDKAAVFAEMARVLRPGGRIGLSDVVADDTLSEADRVERGAYTGCIAGALTRTEYESGLRAAGFEHIDVAFTHEVADRMYGAIIKATRPGPGSS